ncbi:MAG: hypothetical protein ABJC89_26965, partial [Acidobacteriota bacterium]
MRSSRTVASPRLNGSLAFDDPRAGGCLFCARPSPRGYSRPDMHGPPRQAEVTDLLHRWQGGDRLALD